MVNVSLGGTATHSGAEADYTAVPDLSGGDVTIPDGQASVDVSVTPVDDTVSENAETLILYLAAGAGYTVEPGGSSATLTITDSVLDLADIALDGDRSGAAGGDFVAIVTTLDALSGFAKGEGCVPGVQSGTGGAGRKLPGGGLGSAAFVVLAMALGGALKRSMSSRRQQGAGQPLPSFQRRVPAVANGTERGMSQTSDHQLSPSPCSPPPSHMQRPAETASTA